MTIEPITESIEPTDVFDPDDYADEAPALRRLRRPPSWTAATSPESMLEPQYASAARRAAEILRRASLT